jgi:peroxin-19
MSRVEDTQNDDPSMNELEKVFGEEFAAQAEAQLNEAIQMLATENPELMKQFEYYMGGALSGAEGDDKATPLSPPTSIPAKKPQKPPFKKTRSSLDAILEETVRNIQKSSQQAEGGGTPPNLTDMMNKLQLESIDGDEDILKAMEKMMGTLLSKDVLYPSIKELCNQYPEWLRSHEDSLSPEDRARYGKQLEIMTAICTEFEGQGEEMEKQERILQLMQKLQECGQPPDDLGGEPIQPPLLSPGALSPNEQCSVM